MKKSDLQGGMWVTLRSGAEFMVFTDYYNEGFRLINETNWISKYNDDLTYEGHLEFHREYDICEVKVYEMWNLLNKAKGVVLWKRKELSTTQIKINELKSTIAKAQEQINKLGETL